MARAKLGRRSWIVSGAAAAAAASFGDATLLSRAFGQDRVPEDASLAGLSEAYRAAQRAGRPLLVLVIPEQNEGRWARGAAPGALLNHGTDDAMAALGLCEIVCAPMTALRQLVPQAPAGEPLMVLVEPHAMPAAVRALDAALPPGAITATPDVDVAANVDRQIELLSRLVTDALAASLRALDASGRARARDRALALYRRHRISGSYWATDGGCGVYVEDVPETGGYDCGMGHVPPRAQRFLYFFVPR